ncbi:hypothetical protein EWB00_002112 [Schistosoma japonicum]|uniref:Uncharacterized protein n=1 Tax=Schistosoma japonicum TaxID=6182 RepID=A0A4Z2DD78_SCHJA|nr:hypothetical protein EWB00_002112 [Schistosoma japonicum]
MYNSIVLSMKLFSIYVTVITLEFHSVTLAFRAIERSFPRWHAASPDPRVWPANEQLILQTPKRKYSAHDMEVFFKDIYYFLKLSSVSENQTHE